MFWQPDQKRGNIYGGDDMDFETLKTFAHDQLGPPCSPKHRWRCDAGEGAFLDQLLDLDLKNLTWTLTQLCGVPPTPREGTSSIVLGPSGTFLVLGGHGHVCYDDAVAFGVAPQLAKKERSTKQHICHTAVGAPRAWPALSQTLHIAHLAGLGKRARCSRSTRTIASCPMAGLAAAPFLFLS